MALPTTKASPLLEGEAEPVQSDKVMPITKCPHPTRKHYAKVCIMFDDLCLEHVL